MQEQQIRFLGCMDRWRHNPTPHLNIPSSLTWCAFWRVGPLLLGLPVRTQPLQFRRTLMIKTKAVEATKAKTPSASPLLTIRDVAERLQVSERTVHRLIDAGELAVIRIGRSIRVSEDALNALLAPGDKP